MVGWSLRSTLVFSVVLLAACSSDKEPAADAAPDSAVDAAPPADTSLDMPGTDQRAPDPELVVTASGPVRGSVSTVSRAFLGIPFAAPPVGDRRWAKPEPAAPWTAELAATDHGPSCPQFDVDLLGMPASFDEDCLRLSVWTPNPVPKKAPVMVWFYGGGFVAGGISTPLYDGSNLAAQRGVVVVGVNYRLGPLGYFAHPDLPDGGLSYGLLDQQAALRWVKENVAAFGGDPDNVTIFGESAGSMSVCLHLISPGSAGLFHRAVMESVSCLVEAPTRAQTEQSSQFFVEAVGCNDAADEIACLRGKSGEELATALPVPAGVVFGEGAIALPFVDGVMLTEQPRAAFAAGKAAKVPVILGTTKNEGATFVLRIKALDLTEADYAATVTEVVKPSGTGSKVDGFGMYYPGIDPAAVIAAYPAADYDSPAEALSALITDGFFTCPMRALARAVAGQQSTYLYHFLYSPSFFKALNPFFRASHGSEMIYVFGNHPLGINLVGEERDLSELVMGYWTRFAASGDPNGEQAPSWPEYETASDEHLVIDVTPTKGSALQQEKCDFWDTQVAAPQP